MPKHAESPAGVLEFYQNTLEFGRKTQAEHGKWLINTLYLLHSGSIAGIFSRAPTNTLAHFNAPLHWFIVGIALAFLAGLATWTNYQWFIKHHVDLVLSIQRGKLNSIGDIPQIPKSVMVTRWIALAVGLGSFACLILGALSALSILETLPTASAAETRQPCPC